MIRTIIVDDESNARRALVSLIKDYTPNVEVIGEASSAHEAIQMITTLKPDLVLLDMELLDGTGFDVLQNLTDIDFNVVFITAYEQYAVQSFRFAAIDYLLKPVRIHEFREAIDRAARSPLRHQVDDKDQATPKKNAGAQKEQLLVVSELDGFSVARTEEIMYCEAAGGYTVFYFVDGRNISSSRRLGEYEPLLAEMGFLRIHKSFIVNLSMIRKYVKGRGGEVTMMKGQLLPVSRERKQALLDYFAADSGSTRLDNGPSNVS